MILGMHQVDALMIRRIMYDDMYHVFVSGGYIDDQEDHV
jgi:hypothetical protein